jgi:hypothetical protein
MLRLASLIWVNRTNPVVALSAACRNANKSTMTEGDLDEELGKVSGGTVDIRNHAPIKWRET